MVEQDYVMNFWVKAHVDAMKWFLIVRSCRLLMILWWWCEWVVRWRRRSCSWWSLHQWMVLPHVRLYGAGSCGVVFGGWRYGLMAALRWSSVVKVSSLRLKTMTWLGFLVHSFDWFDSTSLFNKPCHWVFLRRLINLTTNVILIQIFKIRDSIEKKKLRNRFETSNKSNNFWND